MSQLNYAGAIHTELFDLFLIDDGYNIPQKLTQIEKTTKKRFFDMTDEEMYNTIQMLKKEDYYSDQEITEDEFKTWRDGK
jgi:hypothetical protein